MSLEKKYKLYKLIAFLEGFILLVICIAYLVSKIPDIISSISRLDPRVIRQEEIIKTQGARIQALQTDRARNEDLTNLLLAIQEFITEKGVIPENLEALREEGYFNSEQNTKDPETGKPYYFQKIDNDFIFCVAMSDQIKGVNTSKCPVEKINYYPEGAPEPKTISEKESVSVRGERESENPIERSSRINPPKNKELSSIQAASGFLYNPASNGWVFTFMIIWLAGSFSFIYLLFSLVRRVVKIVRGD